MRRIIEVFNKCVVCGCGTNGFYGKEYPVCFDCYDSGALLKWERGSMNREEILQMSEGRKMCELMATLIMGWELYEPEPFDDRPRKYWRHPETKESRSVEAWHPDENMTDAWMIVSKMRELVWDFYVGFDSNEENWSVMWRETGGTVIEKCIANTAALAICRSALLAVVPVTDKSKTPAI
jgi:hypothetical protein